jgi:hypothetical protein
LMLSRLLRFQRSKINYLYNLFRQMRLLYERQEKIAGYPCCNRSH